MKFLPAHRQLLGCADEEAVFDKFIESLTDSINLWSYFVNWQKVSNNVVGLEVDLLALNYLSGKQNGEEALSKLLQERPTIAALLPILIACRQKDFSVMSRNAAGQVLREEFVFARKSALTPAEIKAITIFARKSGLLGQFETGRIRNVPDYVFGVEVGLDSNGRKNRGGTQMEDFVQALLPAICSKIGASFLKGASPAKIYAEWNIRVRTDEAGRIFDFAILNDQKLFLVETNYYNGGGTKLKATAGEFQPLQDLIRPQGFEFIWITDGNGWIIERYHLADAFRRIDHVLNLKFIAAGMLEAILRS